MKKNIASPVVFIYIAMYVLIVTAQVLLMLSTNLDWNDDQVLIRVSSITNLVWYGIMAGLYLFLFRTFWRDVVTQFKENKQRYVKLIALGFLSLIVLSMVMSYAYELLGITETSENQEQLNMLLEGAFFDKFSLVLFAVFFAPIVEEMVFRMAGFNILMQIKDVPAWVVITITSFVFGLIHVLTAMDFEQIFYYAGLGALLGVFYYRSKNILVPIAIHMLLNGFVTISMFLY